jgi:formamidopyrimidine-DNA glycosylase
MPELPEVEIIRRGILKDLPRTEIKSVKLTRPDLRFPLPVNELKKIKNKKFIDIQRRGKFLIFKTTSSDFISHLGMTEH